MKVKKPYYLFVFYFVITMACNVLSRPPASDVPPGITMPPTAEIPQVETATKIPPPVASGNGPRGFSAEATSADSVKLSWQPVDGATSYHVAVTTNGGGVITVTDLPSTATEYEDFLAAPESQLIYVVEAISDSASIGQSVANVTTPARQPNPLQVLVEFDPSAAVSQKIGPAGGSISVLDSSGVSYELSIPANALEQEVDISLIPLSDLSEWPLDGEMIGAIGMEPEGLVLNVPALLTITPPSAVAADGFATVGFTFEGYGNEFALRPVDDSVPGSSYLPKGSAHFARPQAQSFSTAVRQWLLELRPAGAGEVSKDHAAQLVRENPPSDSAAAFDQKEAASLASAEDDLAPLSLFPWQRRYDTFQRRIEQVSECWQLTNAITYLIETRNQAQQANDQTHATAERDGDAIAALLEKTKDVFDKAGEECQKKKKEEGKFTNAPCALKLIRDIASGASSVHQELQTRLSEMYGKDALVDAQAKMQNCQPGFVMVGGTDGMKVRDLVCDVTEEFAVHGSVYGGSIMLTFMPSSAEAGELPGGGTYEYEGAGAGVALSGNGAFTMSGSLETTVYIQAEGPGQAGGASGSGSESYTLTPVKYACGSED